MKLPSGLYILFLAIGFCLLFSSDVSAEPKRPNILWITGENFSNDLGCYGQKTLKTPNIDRLAAKGLRLLHSSNAIVLQA